MAWLFRLRTLTTLAGVGAVGGWLYLRDPRATAYKYAVMPLARLAYPDAEDAHLAAINLMQFPILNPWLPSKWLELADPSDLLSLTLVSSNPRVKSLSLATPVGVAAGLDKDGKAVNSLFQFGFSWVEVGSVTPEPQPGNPRPRMFRLEEDKAIVNRYGFNSEGHAAVAARLIMRELQNKQRPGQVLAVNLAKNKTGDDVGDYVKGVHAFGSLADALVVNVSSPNTPGLRGLQQGDKLTSLLTRLVKERDSLPVEKLPQLMVKIAPDISASQINAIAQAVRDSGIDGVIVSNTTIGRPGNLKSAPSLVRQDGGLSGLPVKPLALEALRILRRELGPHATIVGCGGISSADDALEYARAGADFVQLYTSFVYDGPEKPSVIAEDLVTKLNGKTWASVSQSDL